MLKQLKMLLKCWNNISYRQNDQQTDTNLGLKYIYLNLNLRSVAATLVACSARCNLIKWITSFSLLGLMDIILILLYFPFSQDYLGFLYFNRCKRRSMLYNYTKSNLLGIFQSVKETINGLPCTTSYVYKCISLTTCWSHLINCSLLKRRVQCWKPFGGVINIFWK